jgi:hypothetical protein
VTWPETFKEAFLKLERTWVLFYHNIYSIWRYSASDICINVHCTYLILACYKILCRWRICRVDITHPVWLTGIITIHIIEKLVVFVNLWTQQDICWPYDNNNADLINKEWKSSCLPFRTIVEDEFCVMHCFKVGYSLSWQICEDLYQNIYIQWFLHFSIFIHLDKVWFQVSQVSNNLHFSWKLYFVLWNSSAESYFLTSVSILGLQGELYYHLLGFSGSNVQLADNWETLFIYWPMS